MLGGQRTIPWYMLEDPVLFWPRTSSLNVPAWTKSIPEKIMSTKKCHFLHCSVVHACYCPSCILLCSSIPRIDISYFFAMKRPSTSSFAPTSTGQHTSLLSMALRDLSGASNLKHERVGHYLATWALSCPIARRHFNNAVQHVNTATSTQTTVEACKAAVEAYVAPPPPRDVCTSAQDEGPQVLVEDHLGALHAPQI